jgi:large conductance mechanosensitive channel
VVRRLLRHGPGRPPPQGTAATPAPRTSSLVTTFTNWLLSLIPAGATDFGDTKFGLFLTALVSFLVIAAVVYFFIVTPYEKVKTRFGQQEAEASDPDDIVLLKEIRDLLAARQGGAV